MEICADHIQLELTSNKLVKQKKLETLVVERNKYLHY